MYSKETKIEVEKVENTSHINASHTNEQSMGIKEHR